MVPLAVRLLVAAIIGSNCAGNNRALWDEGCAGLGDEGLGNLFPLANRPLVAVTHMAVNHRAGFNPHSRGRGECRWWVGRVRLPYRLAVISSLGVKGELNGADMKMDTDDAT